MAHVGALFSAATLWQRMWRPNTVTRCQIEECARTGVRASDSPLIHGISRPSQMKAGFNADIIMKG
jgi:hypothetical protein